MTKGWFLLILVLGLLLAFSVAVGSATASPGILYAKPSASGSGNCSNWANACTLQAALGMASDGDEIRVAEGTHKPGLSLTDTFQLVSGVGVYGGFAGTETSRAQRDWQSNVTVLSGDIDDNDITDPNDVITTTANITGTNSYHVVTGSSVTETCVLDGFTITGGYANGPLQHQTGGGMYNESGSPSVTNVSFSGNSAGYHGGGMMNDDSNPTLTNVSFTGNSANDGGAMGNYYSSPTLTDVTFTGNSADWDGGGMLNYASSPTVTSVTFSGNSASVGDGGGMYNVYDSSPTLANVSFSGNSAGYHGGGMMNDDSNPTLTNVSFTSNSADQMGGAMFNSNGSPTLTNVIFSGNSAAEWDGGGMWIGPDSSPTLTNVIFSGNSAGYCGGGVGNAGSPTLTNVTFTGNSADWDGGGLWNWYSSLTLTNAILWGNNATNGPQIHNDSSTPTVSYSLVQDSGGSDGSWDTSLGTDGGGNIDADPQFVDADGLDDIVGTLDDNLRLSATSPAIDAGDNSAVPADALDLDGDGNITETLPLDLDGHPRIIGGAVDMGPYEWPVFFTLTKTVTNDDGRTSTVGDFQAYIQGTPVPWGVAQAVISGTYTVSETVQAGYSASTWSGDCAPDGIITLAIGDVKTCSITNDDMAPTVTLTKTVIDDDGGMATVGDFQAYIQATPVPWGVAQSVTSGTYTVSETVQAGYSASAWSGDCAPDGTVTLAIGQDKTCSVTNDDISATLTLTKTVINDDGRTSTVGDFQAYIQGTPVPWSVAQSVISGTYTISETVLAGYSASAWSGDCATDGTITLDIGDVKTCSITNDDMAPTVTLTKTVINDDDGTATLSDFQAYLDGDPVPWGVPQPVIPGTHTASESVLPGYVPTMWGGDCNEDGTIILNVGHDAVCSITNDDTLHSYIPLVLKNYGS